MLGPALVSCLQVGKVLGYALTSLRLVRTDLYRRYPVFAWYMAFAALNATWPLFLNVSSAWYQYLWVLTEPIYWIFYVWVVLELCRLVLDRHRGLYTLGRWAMALGMAIAVTLSVVSLLPRVKPANPLRSKVMSVVLATDRGVTFSLTIFVMVMLFLLSRYPVRLSRNVVLHTVLYTLFFISNTLSVILWSVFGQHVYTAVDTGLAIVSLGCVVLWLLFLNPRGEELQSSFPHFGPEYERQMLRHLDSLNATLLKVARK